MEKAFRRFAPIIVILAVVANSGVWPGFPRLTAHVFRDAHPNGTLLEPETQLEAKPDSVRRCALSGENRNTDAPLPVILSDDNLSVTLTCVGMHNQTVPQEEALVCTESNVMISTCGRPIGSRGRRITLKKLLGVKTEIRWKKKSLEDAEIGQQMSLQLDDTLLPRADKAFFVGCQGKDADTQSTCKLSIAVEAKKSTVKDNIVKCAFGRKSNPQVLEAEMSETRNSLIIDCGSEGRIHPDTYAQYCAVNDAKMKDCNHNLIDILPMFRGDWWDTSGGSKLPSKLTIPPTKFPLADRQFLLGCVHRDMRRVSSRVRRGEKLSWAATVPSLCKVLVSVKAANTSS